MKYNHLAVIVPVDPSQAENEQRQETWAKVSEFLLPHLGKMYTRFEPAKQAWKRELTQSYSVVLGKSEPALFMYILMNARTRQQNAIGFHMEGLLKNVKPLYEEAHMKAFEMTLDTKASQAHFLWHLGMLGGEFAPDCGVYFLRQKEAFVSDELMNEVMSHVSDYALCVVTLAKEEQHAEGES